MARLGGLQATTVAHRLLRLAGRRSVAWAGDWPGDWAGDWATGAPAPTGTPVPDARDRARIAVLVSGLGARGSGDGDALADVLVRALAASGSWDAVDGLAAAWPTLGDRNRTQVAYPLGRGDVGPLRIGGAPARQTDPTTCGSAVLTMLAAAGDPFLALWLVTGRLVTGYVPPELRGARPGDLALPGAGDRFSAVQRAVKRVSTRGGLGPLPWPGALGTPPWGAARTARFPGVAYTSSLVDDTDPHQLTTVLDLADAALAAGVPVPLYTGGDLASGLATAVPRHVVLLVPAPQEGPGRSAATVAGARPYAVYEPGGGRVHAISRARLLAPSGPHEALGRWSHVCWAVLPARSPVRG